MNPPEKTPNGQDSPPAAVDTKPARAAPTTIGKWKKWLLPVGMFAVLAIAGVIVWFVLRPKGPGPGFVSGNGRIEATEIDVATKLGGRVIDVLVDEGDLVTAGQPLAHMQLDVLDAQNDQAKAQSAQALTAVASAQAQAAVHKSDTAAAQAAVAQRESELDAAQRRLARSENLSKDGAASLQDLDDDRARVHSDAAAVTAARAQVSADRAAIDAAQAQVIGTRAAWTASKATIARVQADIDDSVIKSPRAGRVQYRVAQPGEVLASGGTVVDLIDLSDVYMTFFLPEEAAGQLKLGSSVHIILDAAPKVVISARVSFVASTAQFTPKTVESADERQKLMFRVKAQIDRTVLQNNQTLIKSGLPGVAWIKLDPQPSQSHWPDNLALQGAE